MSCNNCGPHFKDKTNPCNGCVGCGQKCHEVVDTLAEISVFRNAFVTVREENAVYHVDDVGNFLCVSRNPIFNNSYTPTAGDYKMTTVYNFDALEGYVFDPDGNFLVITLATP